MLDLTRINVADRPTAIAAEKLLSDNWRYGSSLGDVTLPQSFLLETLANTTVRPILVGRAGWRGQKSRLRGDELVISGVLRMYLSMILGSENIA